jgi:PKD repeat protein
MSRAFAILAFLVGAASIFCFGQVQIEDEPIYPPAVTEATIWGGQKFLAQRVRLTNSGPSQFEVGSVLLENTATVQKLPWAFVANIEIYDADTGALLRSQTPVGEGRQEVTISYKVPAGATRRLEVWLKLKESTDTNPLLPGSKFQVKTTAERVTGEATQRVTFVAGEPGMLVQQTQPLTGGRVYGGQSFLALRILLRHDGPDPYKAYIWAIKLKNTASSPLSDDYIESVAIRLAYGGPTLVSKKPEGLIYGMTLSLAPDKDARARIDPGATLELEVWITLKEKIPFDRGIQLLANTAYTKGGISLRVLDLSGPLFLTGPDTRTRGFERQQTVEMASRMVYGGLRFLAQELTLGDSDDDPYSVEITSVLLQNVASDPLAEQYIEKIEIYRDGKTKLGEITSLAGLNVSGVQLTISANNKVDDDASVTLQVFITLKADPPFGRKLKLSAVVRHSEGGAAFATDALLGPAEFTTGKPSGLQVSDERFDDSLAFSGQRFKAQKIKVSYPFKDDPIATITQLVIRNISTDSPVTDLHVSKIEVTLEDGIVRGQTTTISGLRTDGVSIPVNIFVKGGETIVLEIWVTLKTDVPAGRRLKLETDVVHTISGYSLKATARATKEFITEVNNPPQVTFSWSPQRPKWNETVTFTPTVTDPKDPPGRDRIVYARWEFGDGQSRELGEREDPLSPVRYTYNKGGKFTVKLTVRDDKGLEASTSKEIEVSNLAPTGVDFSWDPKTPKWSDTIAFTPDRNINDPDGDIRQATFSWNFGDGKTLETRGPETVRYSYGKGGEFTVTLTVTDAGGASASKSYKLTISNEPPKNVDFSFSPEKPKWREEVTFTPAREITDPDGDIAKAIFRWDLGDGTTKETTGPQPVTHAYEKFGEFKVTLTVVDQGGASAAKIRTLTVEAPTVDFSWKPEQPKTDEEVTFTAQPEPNEYGFGYRWDFGDGTIWPARDQPPAPTNQATHTYKLAPTDMEKKFTVTLTVTDRDGKTVGTKSKEITVIRVVNKPPTVTRISPTPSQPKPGEEITFTATATDPDGDAIIEWQWDFGDGSPVRTTTAGTTKYTYQKENLYTVKVRAKDAGSNEYGAWFSINLYVGAAPIGVRVLDNPASNQCRIQIFAPENARDLKITILDQAGRPVLLEKPVTIGTFTWDLKDRDGRVVPNGLYLFYVTGKIGDKIERSEIGRILVRR